MLEDPQLSSRLLCLPFEVLARIYDAYLAFGLSDFDDTLRPFHVYLDNGEYSQPLPPFMLTCKRVYNDLRTQVHTEAALKVYMMEFGSRLGFAVHGNLRYARLRKLYFILAMEHPYWNRWLPLFEEVALRSTELQEIVIDWQPRLAPVSRRAVAAAAAAEEGEPVSRGGSEHERAAAHQVVRRSTAAVGPDARGCHSRQSYCEQGEVVEGSRKAVVDRDGLSDR